MNTRNRWTYTNLVLHVVLLCGLASLMVLLQWRTGAWQSELGGHPDEGGHFVNSLVVHDYLLTSPHKSPIRFAESYYIHFPKVTIGHWPPFFYVLQAGWMLAMGRTIRSALLLVAIFAGVIAWLTYLFIERETSHLIGIFTAALLAGTPLFIQYSSYVMAETVSIALALAATLAFVRFMETERARWIVLFALLSAACILTKASGIALILVPCAIILNRDWDLLRKPVLWLSGLLVALLIVPWYWATRKMTAGGFPEPASVGYSLRALRWYSIETVDIAGLVWIPLAIVGVVATLRGLLTGKRDPAGSALLSLLVGNIAVLVLIPSGIEPRYLIALLPVSLFFAVRGASQVIALLPNQQRRAAAWGCALLVLLSLAPKFSFPHNPYSGFSAANTTYLAAGPKAVLLLSDAAGDSMQVSDIAAREPIPQTYVLRGSKVLSSQTWNLQEYRSRFDSTAELVRYLDSVPVDMVFLDVTPKVVPDYERVRRVQVPDPPHFGLVMRAIQEFPDRFVFLSSHPMTRNGMTYPDSLRVFKFVHDPKPLRIEIQLDPLQRSITGQH